MGVLYALCGPSGAGKTTLLQLLQSKNVEGISILPKATDREPRPGEVEGLEYNFYSRDSFLHKVFAGDFCHIENYQGTLFDIERDVVEGIVFGQANGVMQTGIYGAAALINLYPNDVRIFYMYVMPEPHLRSPECLSSSSISTSELISRIKDKVQKKEFGANAAISEAVEKRMSANVIDLASFNGFYRQRKDLVQTDHPKLRILPNLRDKQEETLRRFMDSLQEPRRS
jgi:guanylate kinase